MPTATVTLDYTPEAVAEIQTMGNRVHEIAATFGSFYEGYHLAAATSLASVLVNIVRLGGHITRDGPLQLYGVSFIHYGVIWTPTFRNADWAPDEIREFFHLPGEWSIHS